MEENWEEQEEELAEDDWLDTEEELEEEWEEQEEEW